MHCECRLLFVDQSTDTNPQSSEGNGHGTIEKYKTKLTLGMGLCYQAENKITSRLEIMAVS